jgi:hypothetical protein
VQICIVSAVCSTFLTGCALGGALFVKPGQTIELISASQTQVTVEYTHHYDSELPYAGKVAEEQCSRFGKHSALIQIVQKTIDRSLATFRCD